MYRYSKKKPTKSVKGYDRGQNSANLDYRYGFQFQPAFSVFNHDSLLASLKYRLSGQRKADYEQQLSAYNYALNYGAVQDSVEARAQAGLTNFGNDASVGVTPAVGADDTNAPFEAVASAVGSVSGLIGSGLDMLKQRNDQQLQPYRVLQSALGIPEAQYKSEVNTFMRSLEPTTFATLSQQAQNNSQSAKNEEVKIANDFISSVLENMSQSSYFQDGKHDHMYSGDVTDMGLDYVGMENRMHNNAYLRDSYETQLSEAKTNHDMNTMKYEERMNTIKEHDANRESQFNDFADEFRRRVISTEADFKDEQLTILKNSNLLNDAIDSMDCPANMKMFLKILLGAGLSVGGSFSSAFSAGFGKSLSAVL